MPSTPSAMPASMSDALARLWNKFRSEIEGRLSLLEAAGRAVSEGALTGEQRESAHQAAHKLAGVLGTFGLHRGTDLARQIELEFAEEVPAAATSELCAWIAELRMLIDRRNR